MDTLIYLLYAALECDTSTLPVYILYMTNVFEWRYHFLVIFIKIQSYKKTQNGFTSIRFWVQTSLTIPIMGMFSGKNLIWVISRLTLVSGLKWVDEVIANAPYEITEEFMHRLFNEHNIDYIIHGDDPCLLPDGTDAYALAKKAGRYKQIKRTEGVSSTDIVGTVILLYNITICVKQCIYT